MTTALTVPQVLRAAADHLSKPGAWAQNFFVDAAGCRCALGGIAYVAKPSDPYGNPLMLGDVPSEAADVFANYLVDHLGAPLATDGDDEYRPITTDAIETVGNWNDEDQRTQDEVVAALRAAADEYEQRQAARAARTVTA